MRSIELARLTEITDLGKQKRGAARANTHDLHRSAFRATAVIVNRTGGVLHITACFQGLSGLGVPAVVRACQPRTLHDGDVAVFAVVVRRAHDTRWKNHANHIRTGLGRIT